MISLIAAVAENNAIGNGNQLLWHIAGDLKYFKAVTTGHPVIMGRKTFESIRRPLPGRRNIVVSRSRLELPQPPMFKKDGTPSNTSIEQVEDLEVLLKSLRRKGKEEYFVIGGGSVYNAAFKFADRLYITRIFATPEKADTFFPEIKEVEWETAETSPLQHDEENDIDYQFVTCKRKKPRK